MHPYGTPDTQEKETQKGKQKVKKGGKEEITSFGTQKNSLSYMINKQL